VNELYSCQSDWGIWKEMCHVTHWLDNYWALLEITGGFFSVSTGLVGVTVIMSDAKKSWPLEIPKLHIQ
jgi:hypothetical protein